MDRKKIPLGWTTDKLKYNFSFGKGLPITKDNLKDEGLPVVSYGQIHAKYNSGVNIDPSLLRYVENKYSTLFPLCEVKKYDFVLQILRKITMDAEIVCIKETIHCYLVGTM